MLQTGYAMLQTVVNWFLTHQLSFLQMFITLIGIKPVITNNKYEVRIYPTSINLLSYRSNNIVLLYFIYLFIITEKHNIKSN